MFVNNRIFIKNILIIIKQRYKYCKCDFDNSNKIKEKCTNCNLKIITLNIYEVSRRKIAKIINNVENNVKIYKNLLTKQCYSKIPNRSTIIGINYTNNYFEIYYSWENIYNKYKKYWKINTKLLILHSICSALLIKKCDYIIIYNLIEQIIRKENEAKTKNY